MKLCGVYKITNVKTKKMYIGSSCDINTRWTTHLRDLRNGTHGNTHLQRSFTLYGETNFEFTILELCEKDELIEREQYYIDQFHSYQSDKGYNICHIAGSVTKSDFEKYQMSKKYIGIGNPFYGKHHTEETKAKIHATKQANGSYFCYSEESKIKHRNSWYAKYMSEDKINTMKNAIILYDNSDCTLEYVAKLFNIAFYQLRRALCGQEYVALQSDERIKKAVLRYNSGITRNRHLVCVATYNSLGELCGVYNSLTEASQHTGALCTNISVCIKNPERKSMGLYFRKIDDKNNVPQKIILPNVCLKRHICLYDLYGKYIATFSSQKEAAQKLNIPSSEISTILSGKNTHYSNYRFGWFLDNPMCYDISPDFTAIEMMQKLQKKPLRFYKMTDKDNVMYSKSVHDAARLTGCNRANINTVLNGKASHTKGYVFEYVNQ